MFPFDDKPLSQMFSGNNKGILEDKQQGLKEKRQYFDL